MSVVNAFHDKQGKAYGFHCPGCNMEHIIPISYEPKYSKHNGKLKPIWWFNGDLNKPTFKPDFKIEWRGAQPPQCCHCIIRDGFIIFLVESTHHLSGSRLKLAEV